MDRIYASGAIETPPEPPATPSPGYPTAGNPAGAVPATRPGPWWFHMITEELRGVILAAGLSPDHEDLTQLVQALNTLYMPVSGGRLIQSIAAQTSANNLVISYDGGRLDFRSPDITNGESGAFEVDELTLTVPSGATLGTVNGQRARLIVLVALNAGEPVLCIGNQSGGQLLDETSLISPTTISAAAGSASVIYSAAPVVANSPYRVVGFVDITSPTAGQWSAAPLVVQPAGGLALAALSAFGYGQWVNVTASRALATTYYNTTARPIAVSGYCTVTNQSVGCLVDGALVFQNSNPGTANQCGFSFVVPPGASYRINSAGSLTLWSELR